MRPSDGFLINRTGLLDFIDPMLREAVKQVFLQHKSMERNGRKRLARFLNDRYRPSDQRFSEVAWQNWQAMDDPKLLECITHPEAFQMFRLDQNQSDFMIYCRHVGKSAVKGGSGYGIVLEKLIDRLQVVHWTVIPHDCPNHLGLWFIRLSSHMMALITSGCS